MIRKGSLLCFAAKVHLRQNTTLHQYLQLLLEQIPLPKEEKFLKEEKRSPFSVLILLYP